MIHGLLDKAWRETRVLVALASVALALVMALFVQILPQFEEGLGQLVSQVPFLRTLLSGLLGMDVGEGLGPELLLVVVWTHPIVLSIVWGVAVALATRVPAAEIERGTIDVLLGWPVSRRALYWTETLVAAAAGLALVACGALGYGLGLAGMGAGPRPDPAPVGIVVANLFLLYVAVAAIAQAVSAACDRRGSAVGIAVAFLMASFLIQFLSTLWEPARLAAGFSVVHYYQPARVMTGGGVPWGDLAVLALTALGAWLVGAAAWRRRSVLTT